MAQFGTRKSASIGNGYQKDPLHSYAQSFNETVTNIMNESGIDFYKEPTTALFGGTATKSALEKFFVENSFDTNGLSAQDVKEKTDDMKALFENDVEGIREASNVASFNALVGLSLPMHKNIMMNMVFDKGAIPKAVAVSEKFTRSMERRFLVTPEGKKIDFYKEQALMTDAIENVNPFVDIELTLPEVGTTDVLVEKLNGAKGVDHVDVETYVGKVALADVYFKTGEVLPDENGNAGLGEIATQDTKVEKVWYEVDLRFNPGYGLIKRQLMREVVIPGVRTGEGVTGSATAGEAADVKDVISGTMVDDVFTIQSAYGKVVAVVLRAKLDASSRTIPTCTVSWDEITEIVEIGTDPGVNTTVSPEEVKDLSVLYGVNQLTKVMSLMKTVLANRKDDKIKKGLDQSYARLGKDEKFYGVFDYAPPARYVLDHIEYRRKTFFEYFDSQISQMLRVLNDPNMVVSVFGEPDVIRKITPVDYTYQSPANIGPVDLDFAKTVVTSDNRVYQFIGSDKLRNNYELIVTLCPKNTNRIIYIIYDYQMYISNEIRNNANPALPNICAFERWKFDEYQPVQGRIQIVNPSGIRADEGSETKYFRA